jgi:hypothetical protein
MLAAISACSGKSPFGDADAMDFTDLKDYVALSKEAIDLLKAAWNVLPESDQRDDAQRKLEAAAALLVRSDARLAKDLGYRMCQCTFPPQIMLWVETENAWVCRNVACGSKVARTRTREWEEEQDQIKTRKTRR